ncbi:chromatin complex subunit A [Zea mays]|uniref:Chromatin complex subunit A n=1 Tax=Zea mays TaxID=4577 RepID=A0A1D6J223_MAIZE|nr:chromatin complex subunit A [Zea mays]
MAASVDAAAALAVTPPAVEEAGGAVEQARTLIGALNLLSRNLPLPPDVLRAVSSIYHDGGAGDDEEEEGGEREAEKEGNMEMTAAEEGYPVDVATKGSSLIEELEDAIYKNKKTPISYSELAALKEGRFNASIQHRLAELEGLPSTRGEDLQMKCLLEMYGLKLLDLQKKVRSDISAEYWLQKKCAYPERQLFDWGLMRIRYPLSMYGIGDILSMDADDVHRKKRFTERMSRLEEEEKNQADIRKRKFFAEILNASREHQVQLGTTFKQRKQRNDGVQAWHVRARQRISRQEKNRLNLLKIGDQVAYMKMVEESKNERLKMLLDKTNELLEGIGKAVQRQKDAEHVSQHEGSEVPKGSESEDCSQISGVKSESPGESPSDDDADFAGSADESKFNAGRRLDFTVHSIEEKVTEQPSALEGGELRPYQLEGLQWMLSLFNNNLNGILADEMGLGKTIQTIALIAYLLENKEVAGPHLIIAPKAVLPNWSNEFKTWAPSIGTILYDGRPEERKLLREKNFDGLQFNVLLTHYDLILKDKKFLKKVHWHYLIVDEGHRLKNHECALARTLVSGFLINSLN